MAREEVKKSRDMKGNGEMKSGYTEDECVRERTGLKESLKEKEASLWGKKTQKRESWDSLHTTVPANLLRNKLTSVFHIKAPI